MPFDGFSEVQRLLPLDLTINWADPLGINCADQPPVGACAGIYRGPVPTSPHLHGGEVTPGADGGPDAWFTPFDRQLGIGFVSNTLNYPNGQEAATLWFHAHALGSTRLDVYAGMAGAYIIKDPYKEPRNLPAGKYDVPLVIQDRSFDTKGRLFYNLAANAQPNPDVHPWWIPEFLGDVIVVNGKTWPFMNVEPRKYRFRIVNGSNARFYNLYFGGLPVKVIATDGGYLNAPVDPPLDPVDSTTGNKTVLMGPGERYEIIVDFKGMPAGSRIQVTNNAPTPFPGGDPVDPDTTAQIMEFRRVPLTGYDDSEVPANLRPKNPIVRLTPQNVIKRQLTLNEISGPGGPLRLVINNTEYNKILSGFNTRDTELPAVGDTEIWEFINISADAHPLHIHLIQFQILNRQPFDIDGYLQAYGNIVCMDDPPANNLCNVAPGDGPPNPYLAKNDDGAIGGNISVGPYLTVGNPVAPVTSEQGWKDTAIMYPGEITRVAVRWAPVDAPATGKICPTGVVRDYAKPCVPKPGSNLYPFNPTELVNGVGYVMHCHILEHEDNEMMRPYTVEMTRQITP